MMCSFGVDKNYWIKLQLVILHLKKFICSGLITHKVKYLKLMKTNIQYLKILVYFNCIFDCS